MLWTEDSVVQAVEQNICFPRPNGPQRSQTLQASESHAGLVRAGTGASQQGDHCSPCKSEKADSESDW